MPKRTPATVGTAGLVASALLLGACTSDSGSNGSGTTATGATGAMPTAGSVPADQSPAETAVWPITQDNIDTAVADLDATVSEMMEATGVPGAAVAVVHGDEVVYAKGFGVRDVDTGEAVDADTVFQLASLSKPLGATVVAGAVGDGTVAWDDPIVEHLPDFALADPYVTEHVTIEDMYAHRSGLPEHAGDLLEDLGYDRQQVFERLRFLPLDPFRATYHYTNFGLTAGGEAVATAAGTTWEELSRTRLYDRIGMASTSSTFADFEASPNHAVGHQEHDGTWVVTDPPRQPDAQSPAGGASSSVNDMAQWMRLVLGDGTFEGTEVIDAEALLQAHTPFMVSSPSGSSAARPNQYGLGTGVGVDETGRVRLSHSGAFALGAATTINLMPDEGLGIVVLTNGWPIGLPEAITAAFMDEVVNGTTTRDWLPLLEQRFEGLVEGEPSALGDTPPADPEPARDPGAYTGTYANDYFGEAQVAVVEAGGLQLRLGPDAMAFPLTHWDGDVFTMDTIGENASGISAVTFTVGADGTATDLVIEKYDKVEGVGVFTRR